MHCGLLALTLFALYIISQGGLRQASHCPASRASTGWITSHKRVPGGWTSRQRLVLGATLVPWGMRLGPDGALYVAVNPSYAQVSWRWFIVCLQT